MFGYSLLGQLKKVKNKTISQSGFTVIELIVIMSIFAIMASVSLYNFQGFDDSTNINNLALDIALEIKRAQTLGSSSIDDISGDKSAMSVVFFSIGGGMFDPKIIVAREFPIIATNDGDLGFLGPLDSIDRVLEIFGGTIEQICFSDGVAGGACNQTNDDISISFRRPYTEPIITSPSCGGDVFDTRSNVTYYHVCHGETIEIRLVSQDGSRKRTIVIEPTGNIYTRNN